MIRFLVRVTMLAGFTLAIVTRARFFGEHGAAVADAWTLGGLAVCWIASCRALLDHARDASDVRHR